MTTSSDAARLFTAGSAMSGLRRRVAEVLGGTGDRARAGRNALIAFAIRIGSAAILFLSQVAIARWMGGSEYGFYVYCWTWVLVVGGLSTVGLNFAAIRLVSEYRATGRYDLLRGFLRAGRLTPLLIGSLVAALLAAGLWLASTMLQIEQPPAIWIALLAIPAFALTDVQDGICRGAAHMLTALFAPYILRPLLVLAGIAILHLTGMHMLSGEAVMVAVAATWTALLAQTVVAHRQIITALPATPRAYDWPHWRQTALPLLLTSACDLVLQNADVLLITNLVSAREAGVYFAAAKTMGLIMLVAYAVGSAMASRYSALSAQGDPAGLKAAVRDGVRWTFWPSLALGAAMLAFGKLVLGLFGPGFAEGYPVMCVLVLAFLVRAAIGPADILLNMTGGQRETARSLLIAAGLNIVLDLLLVPQLGMMGAAIGVSVALVTSAILNYRAACRRLGFDIGIWAVSRRA